MKRRFTALTLFFSSLIPLWAGESGLTTTFQPLDGLGSGGIQIVSVTCHDWYSHSGLPTSIHLISAANVPPTNNPKEATENLNLASVCGLRFSCGGEVPIRELFLDATNFAISKRFGHPREKILRACLECLRRCLPRDAYNVPLELSASETDREWMEEIVNEFNAHDRTKEFFVPEF